MRRRVVWREEEGPVLEDGSAALGADDVDFVVLVRDVGDVVYGGGGREE